MKIPDSISNTAEDYLKLIYHLQQESGKATIKGIAKGMGVKAPSATSMIKKLAALGILGYIPYKSITLTPSGSRVALEVIRHHRLLELYLAQALKYGIEKVHDEADELEHAISEEFEAKIDKALGYPKVDPHGSPIPGADGNMVARAQTPLSEAPTGVYFTVSQVALRESGLLGYAASLGMVPGARVRVLEKKPYRGPIHVQIGRNVRETIGVELARQIYLRATKKRGIP
jgi:DtxR family Mn-dependent transcriptional regulator